MTFLKKVLFDCFINFGATLISAYLLYDDLLLFISKPTHSSKFNEKLQPKHLPDFFVCPIPAFDLDILKKHGYSGGYLYMKGIFRSNVTNMIGWNGDSDTNQTFIDEISVKKLMIVQDLQLCFNIILKQTTAFLALLHLLIQSFLMDAVAKSF